MNGPLQTTICLSSLTTEEVEKWKNYINLGKMNPTYHTSYAPHDYPLHSP